MKHKNKKVIGAKQMLGSALAVFAFFNVIADLDAETRKGIIRNIERIFIPATGHHLALDIDTTGNRIPDTTLVFLDPVLYPLARHIRDFVERGMEVIFDDEGHSIGRNSGIMIVNGDNTISIDGDNMIFLFPNERERFKHAARVYDRQSNLPQDRGSNSRPEDRPVLAYTPAVQARIDKARREIST
ncbi:MAG: hypothetical protein FWD24_02560 [Treponema sp.]|nr:hypothetical protein [Treponema sp.]